jgi:hypothetical protein
MREIQEIIDELKSHPDYMVSEIFTWNDYLEEVNECYYDEYEGEDFKPIQKSELTPELIEDIINHTKRSLSYIYNPYMIFNRNEDSGNIEIEYE